MAEFDNEPPLIFPGFDTITDDQRLHGHATSAQHVPYRLSRPSANLGPGVATEDRDVEDQEYIVEACSSYKVIHNAFAFLAPKLSELSAINKTLLTSRLSYLPYPIRLDSETHGTKVINSPTSPGSKMPPSSSSKWPECYNRLFKRPQYSIQPQRFREAGRYEAETIRNVATCFERLYRCITNKLVIDRIGLQISQWKIRNDAPH